MAKDVVQDAAEKSNDWCPKCKTSGNCLADCKYHPNNKAQQTTYQAQEDKGTRGGFRFWVALCKSLIFSRSFGHQRHTLQANFPCQHKNIESYPIGDLHSPRCIEFFECLACSLCSVGRLSIQMRRTPIVSIRSAARHTAGTNRFPRPEL